MSLPSLPSGQLRWTGADGQYWARQHERLDATHAPVTGPLLDFAAPAPGSTVVDIGCGCGATTLELARAVGPTGRVVGIDISEPMLEVARERLMAFPNAAFINGDAASLPLADLRAELIFSRFGVMFFADPVAAFTNLRTALVPGGRIRFACWRSMGENPWLHVPLQAVEEHVPRPPRRDPDEPGPFAFADPIRVARILTAAGFTEPSFTPLNVELDIAAEGTFEDAVAQASGMGPASRLLADQPPEVHDAAIGSIRRALRHYASAEGVKLPAAVWLVATCQP